MAAGIIGAALLSGSASKGPWTPPQQAKPATYYVLISGAQNAPAASQSIDASGASTIKGHGVTTQMYVFDAVMSIAHQQDSQITNQPVQTGANISDHAYAMPARVTLEIGMSDAMSSYASSSKAPNAAAAAGVWTGPSKSKSVNAFNEIVSWATNRVLLTLGTRLNSYKNMLVESISSEESNKTIASLRCRVVFKQVFIANVQSVTVSALPQTTQSTAGGATNGTPPTNAQISQYQNSSPTTVHGAGTWASV